MATTSVGTSRKPYGAMEKYGDAVFITDDKKLFFGTGGDVSFEYDEDGNDVLAMAGADIRISDTQQLQIGDGGDLTLSHDGSNSALGIVTGALVVSKGDVRFSDTTQLQFGDTSDIRIYYNATSDVLMLKGFPTTLSDANPNVSDALYLVSDVKGTTSWILAVSAGA